jgi:hypothetical protein
VVGLRSESLWRLRHNTENSLLNSLIAGKSGGDGRDQHCNASQPVYQPEIVTP